jgi:hypothetical protein
LPASKVDKNIAADVFVINDADFSFEAFYLGSEGCIKIVQDELQLEIRSRK